MTKHIGIAACSAEGAALCYTTICAESSEILGIHAHPEITMHTYPLSEYMHFLRLDDWAGVADLMVSSAEKLAGSGADFIICPDNTIHQAFDSVVARCKIPWLHIAEEVASVAVKNNYRLVGLLGTKYLMEGPVYPGKLSSAGIGHRVPSAMDRARINEIIFAELVQGEFNQVSRRFFSEVITGFKQSGCDAIVLGCTEIPLLIAQDNSDLPFLDSTRILARAAIAKATQG